jgi:hypothetical protein
MGFLSSALEDSGSEAQSTVSRFSQAQQKIILNHMQFVSLAAGFPLKWPTMVENMFEAMSLVGNAGSYMFNPSCSKLEIVEGESMFFQKQLGVLVMPFIGVILCIVFWSLIGLRNFCDPPSKRAIRSERNQVKRALKISNTRKKLNEKKRKKIVKKKASKDFKMEKRRIKESMRLAKEQSKSNNDEEKHVILWLHKIDQTFDAKYGTILVKEGYDSTNEFYDIAVEDLLDLGVKNDHAQRIVKSATALAEDIVGNRSQKKENKNTGKTKPRNKNTSLKEEEAGKSRIKTGGTW